MRTINDIVPPSRRQETGPVTSPSSHSSHHRDTPKIQLPIKTLVVVVVIIAASLGALYYFSSAKVEVTPNTVSAAIQNSFTADQKTGDLPYEIITAQKIASQSVKSSGTKTVSSFASGTITIYNTQSKAQRLITNTRFATTAGLIFHIHTAVSVPAGTATNPGSIKAKVYADKPGDSYNVGPTSFTVPGFAGTPLASEVTARSSDVMSGGASGTIPVVDTSTNTQAQMALIKALAPDLSTSLQNEVPTGYILLPGSATTTFEELTPTVSTATSSSMIDVKEQGTITGVVFPRIALAKALATSVAGLGYQGEPMDLLPTSNLQLTAVSLPDASATSFSFTLAGTAALSYAVDPTRIAAAVAGKSRGDAETALTNYPEIKRAIIILRPFWRQSFPQDPSSIDVTVVTP
ncbi:MAG: hypothetical protein ACHQU0_00690 [Candidatus Paceibacteria bacterium]